MQTVAIVPKRLWLLCALAAAIAVCSIASPASGQARRDSVLTQPLLDELRWLLVPSNPAYSDTLVREVAELHASFGDREAAVRILREHGSSFYGFVRVANIYLRRDKLDDALYVARQAPEPKSKSQALGHIAQHLFYIGRTDEALEMARGLPWLKQRIEVLKYVANRVLESDSVAARAFLAEAVEIAQADTSAYGAYFRHNLAYDQIEAGDYSALDRVLSDSLPPVELANRLWRAAHAFQMRGDTARTREFADQTRAVLAEIEDPRQQQEVRDRLDRLPREEEAWRPRPAAEVSDSTTVDPRRAEIDSIIGASGVRPRDRDLPRAFSLFDSVAVDASAEEVVRSAASVLGPLWGNGGRLYGLIELRDRERFRAVRDEAVARIADIDDPERRSDAIAALGMSLLHIDRPLALQLVLKIPVREARDEALEQFIARQISTSPDSAAALLALLPDGEPKRRYQELLVRSRINRNPERADSLIATLQSKHSRASLYERRAWEADRAGAKKRREALLLKSLHTLGPPSGLEVYDYDSALYMLLNDGHFDSVLEWAHGQPTQEGKTYALVHVARAMEHVQGWRHR